MVKIKVDKQICFITYSDQDARKIQRFIKSEKINSSETTRYLVKIKGELSENVQKRIDKIEDLEWDGWDSNPDGSGYVLWYYTWKKKAVDKVKNLFKAKSRPKYTYF